MSACGTSTRKGRMASESVVPDPGRLRRATCLPPSVACCVDQPGPVSEQAGRRAQLNAEQLWLLADADRLAGR